MSTFVVTARMDKTTGISTMSDYNIADAKEFLHSIQIENSKFATMSDEDIRNERMQSKKLFSTSNRER